MAFDGFLQKIKKGYDTTQNMANIAKEKYQVVEEKVDSVKQMKKDIELELLPDKVERLEKKMQSYVVKKPSIQLFPNEKCYYQGAASSVFMKNMVVASQRTSSHQGISLWGVYHGEGTSTNVPIRGTVTDKYEGRLYITSQRIVMTAIKGGFEIQNDKLTSIELYSDGFLITKGANSYLIETKDVKKIKNLLKTNNELIQSLQYLNESNFGKAQAEKVKDDIDKSVPELLREYKQLLDEGIISQEEFELQKKKLLNS